ncbi:DUF1810 family protein [Comamonas antarctica]|uniref:DUF1810 domain-containing protein n=1 Tax=Comamonas antarctica TaxID=2743470 RepID=UPI0028EB60EB|nr:DUF1810 family protein [Comamonas antarctica]
MTPETPRDAEFQPFIDAQRGVFETALQELRAGQKQSHWMWFVFPQLDGLGRSAMARRFAIQDLAQARRYLQHPLLGARLTEAAQTAQAALQAGTGLLHLFGAIDSQKFISCMTLFRAAAGEDSVFAQILLGLQASDGKTLEMLGIP